MEKTGLRGTRNTRDFAGTVIETKGMVRRGVCLRSDALDALTDGDVRYLKEECPLAAVIDLRTEQEQKERPDREITGVDRYSIPLLSGSELGITHEKQTDSGEMFRGIPDMRVLYKRIVTETAAVARLKEVFMTILKYVDEGKGAVLWHCTEGKDRCGIVSALFLTLLGADRETVFRDYMMTNDSAQKRAEEMSTRIESATGDAALARQVMALFTAKEEYLTAAFEAIRLNWGDDRRFFEEALGITEEMRQELIRKVVVRV